MFQVILTYRRVSPMIMTFPSDMGWEAWGVFFKQVREGVPVTAYRMVVEDNDLYSDGVMSWDSDAGLRNDDGCAFKD